MKKSMSMGICTAIIGAATLAFAGQEPAPQTPAAPAQSTDAKKVTVTGCLKADPTGPAPTASAADAAGTAGTTGTAGTAGTTGTAGTAGSTTPTPPATASPDARFLLADATAGPAPEPDTTAAAAPAAPTAGGEKVTYRLIANSSALTPHLGKKLELTGTIEADASSPAQAQTASSSEMGPKLRVESGKVIAASCDAK